MTRAEDQGARPRPSAELAKWDPLEPVIFAEIAPDDAVVLSVVVDADGVRHAALLPRSVEKLSPVAQILVSEAQHAVSELRQLQSDIGGLAYALRSEGASWHAIGWCVGTTGEAARQRWGASEESPAA